MKFINRDHELKFLNEKWNERKAQLIIIYGKRRVGKTELIKQFIKNKDSVYFLADKRNQIEQLKELGRIIGEKFNDSILEKNGFSNWLEVFEYLRKNVKKSFVLAFDEYPYLIEADRSVSSLFQKGWDNYLKESKVFLILSGSSVSIMESEALIYKSPLFGRRTGQILLNSLTFYESWKFFPKKKFSDFLKIYSVTGGMPAYLLQFDKNALFKENVLKKIFNRQEYLYNEVEFLLKEELREPKNYLSILKAISFGRNKISDIVIETGLEKNVIIKYLSVLEKLLITEREVPVTEKDFQKSRKGVHKISDNFVRFWFRYIFPYKSELEIGKVDEVIKILEKRINILESVVYEKVCQEIYRKLENKMIKVDKLGRWWEKDREIDIVGINSKTNEIIFGEAKWSEKKVGTNIFTDLKKKSEFVDWRKGNRREYFILFSKSGFTTDLKKLAKEQGIFLVKKDKLEKSGLARFIITR